MKQKKKNFSSTQIINIARTALLTNTTCLGSVVIIVQHIMELKQITVVFAYKKKYLAETFLTLLNPFRLIQNTYNF